MSGLNGRTRALLASATIALVIPFSAGLAQTAVPRGDFNVSKRANAAPRMAGGALGPEGVVANRDGVIITSAVTPAGLTRYTPNINFQPPVFNPGGGGQ